MVGIVGALIWTSYVNGLVVPGAPAPPPPTYDWTNFPLTHLWFLYVLTLFYAGVLILRAPFALLDRDGGWGRMVDRMTGALIGPWTPALMAAPLAVAFWLAPNWTPFFGIPTPDTCLVPNPVALTAFGTAFGLGVLLDRRRDLLVRIERLWPVFTVVALGVGTGALVLAGGPVPELVPVTDPELKAPLAAVMALAVFASTFAVLSLALRFASGYSAVRRYIADSSYWVYIVHLPLVMVGQILVVNETWPWFVKFGVVIGGTLAISLLTYELLIRHTFMGGWLNGRRIPWHRQRDAEFSPAE
jgi:hypothetical protein